MERQNRFASQSITLTPAQVVALAQWGATHPIRVGQPMFLMKPDFEPLDPDVSLKMEKG